MFLVITRPICESQLCLFVFSWQIRIVCDWSEKVAKADFLTKQQANAEHVDLLLLTDIHTFGNDV